MTHSSPTRLSSVLRSNAHVASDCTRQRSVSPNSHAAFLNAATASRTSKGGATDPGWHFGNFDSTDPSGSDRRRTAKKICQEIAEASRRTEGNMYVSGLKLSVSWRAAKEPKSKHRSTAIRCTRTSRTSKDRLTYGDTGTLTHTHDDKEPR